MQWTKVTIPRGRNDATEWRTIQGAFEAAFMVANAPETAAMFSDQNMAGKPMTFYFSPLAAQMMSGFLETYDVVLCSAPADADVSLLVGHAQAREILKLPGTEK